MASISSTSKDSTGSRDDAELELLGELGVSMMSKADWVKKLRFGLAGESTSTAYFAELVRATDIVVEKSMRLCASNRLWNSYLRLLAIRGG